MRDRYRFLPVLLCRRWLGLAARRRGADRGAGAAAGPGARRHGDRRLDRPRPGRLDRQPGRRRTSCSGPGSATGPATWDEYGAFIARHPDWPGLQTLRRAGERQMPEGCRPRRSSPSSAASRRRPAPARCASPRRWPTGGRSGRGRGRDRPRLARVLADRPASAPPCCSDWREVVAPLQRRGSTCCSGAA